MLFRSYIYLHEGEDDGETEYKALIPVIGRPEPSDLEPTPVQQDAITQAIAALNTAVTHVEDVADDLQSEIVDAVTEELATGQYKGEKGDKGDKGDQGDRGEKGEQGEQGIQGIQGLKGDKGDKGDTGEAGAKGDKGDTGDTGQGVPTGGTAGQFLAKHSATDFDTEWVTILTATASANGLMSSTDKSRLDSLTDSYINQLIAAYVDSLDADDTEY